MGGSIVVLKGEHVVVVSVCGDARERVSFVGTRLASVGINYYFAHAQQVVDEVWKRGSADGSMEVRP